MTHVSIGCFTPLLHSVLGTDENGNEVFLDLTGRPLVVPDAQVAVGAAAAVAPAADDSPPQVRRSNRNRSAARRRGEDGATVPVVASVLPPPPRSPTRNGEAAASVQRPTGNTKTPRAEVIAVDDGRSGGKSQFALAFAL